MWMAWKSIGMWMAWKSPRRENGKVSTIPCQYSRELWHPGFGPTRLSKGHDTSFSNCSGLRGFWTEVTFYSSRQKGIFTPLGAREMLILVMLDLEEIAIFRFRANVIIRVWWSVNNTLKFHEHFVALCRITHLSQNNYDCRQRTEDHRCWSRQKSIENRQRWRCSN
jgi:hypothetical protein